MNVRARGLYIIQAYHDGSRPLRIKNIFVTPIKTHNANFA